MTVPKEWIEEYKTWKQGYESDFGAQPSEVKCNKQKAYIQKKYTGMTTSPTPPVTPFGGFIVGSQGAKYWGLHGDQILKANDGITVTLTPEENVAETEIIVEKRTYAKGEKSYNIKVIDLFGSYKFQGGGGPNIKKGEIGLEVECEGTDLFKSPLSYWTMHNEHSLRKYKGHDPAEYALKAPVSRGVLDKALAYLKHRLESGNAFVADSPRTSVHVHLNCQYMTMAEVITFYLLYLIVEELLVEFCGEGRVANLFCLRVRDAGHFFLALQEAISSESYSGLSSDDLRYTACNTAALAKFGSLEFRTGRCWTDGEGYLDTDKIKLWVDILQGIKAQAALLDGPTSVCALFEKLGPDDLLHYIFPDDKHYAIFAAQDDVRSRVWAGFRQAKELAYSCSWKEPLPVLPGTETAKVKTKKKPAYPSNEETF